MDQTPGAGPSVRRVDGEEVDVDVSFPSTAFPSGHVD